jgi:nitrous oxide reductase accessory protein NosL
MEEKMKRAVAALTILFLMCTVQGSIAAGPKAGEGLNEKSRCPVCGMFVEKYPQWLAQINMSNGHAEFFDGVKDMLAYYFSPGQYGAAAGDTVEEVFVKDYYKQEWIDGRKAVYVLGSDVYGPMGHELIPFSDRAAAENFLKDHHGKKIFSFAEITPEIIESLRKGHTMKGHSMPAKK